MRPSVGVNGGGRSAEVGACRSPLKSLCGAYRCFYGTGLSPTACRLLQMAVHAAPHSPYNRLKPQLLSNGALNIKSPQPSSSAGRAGGQTPAAGTDEAPSSSTAGVDETSMQPFVPEWRLLEANDWKKRTLALGRFTQAVHRVIVQMRYARRMAKMQDFLAQVWRRA